METPPDCDNCEDQIDCWERFYQENKRPWRGVGKINGLDIDPNSKVLDIGCGNGKTTSALIKIGMDVTGLDFSPSAVSHCISVFGDKAKFSIAECNHMPFPDDSFHAITAVHILEHLNETQLKETVGEMSRVLMPGGLVFVRVFAVGDSRSEGKNRNVRGNGIEYRYYTEEEMASIFKGFEMIRCDRKDETMRFGAVRVKIECLLRLPCQ